MRDVTVLIVDDQRLVREGVASLLDIQEGISVVGTAADGSEGVQKALADMPDVILMDVRMPVMDGISATRQIKQQLPGCQVLILSTFDDDEYIIKALQAGAGGYLLKDIPAENLAQAVRLVHAGIYQLAPSVAGKLVGQLDGLGQKKRPRTQVGASADDLTDRELEVLRLIATGATNREIAQELVVSEGTVSRLRFMPMSRAWSRYLVIFPAFSSLRFVRPSRKVWLFSFVANSEKTGKLLGYV